VKNFVRLSASPLTTSLSQDSEIACPIPFNDLNFYTKATWNKSYVAGTVDAGLGFIIDATVDVNGSPQYRVHNSKGNTYFITASDAYVKKSE
ncbi:hypothetical protein AALF16_23825, partial [Bacillus cereus]